MNENENIHPTPNSTEKEEPVAVPNENTVVQEPQKEVCVTADNIENPTASAESTEPKTEETKTEEIGRASCRERVCLSV